VKELKKKLIFLSLTAICALIVIGCTSQKDKDMKNTMTSVSQQLDSIDNNTNNSIELTYNQAQDLMEKIYTQLSEFNPQLTPDKQSVIINLETREKSEKLEHEYIIISMVAGKSNYSIHVKGNIFNNKEIPKGDSAVSVLYDLLISTKSIHDMSISKFINKLDEKVSTIDLDNNSTAFNKIDFNYSKDIVKFNATKFYKREAVKTNEVKYSFEEYKNKREDLQSNLTKYVNEFAKSNNLTPVIHEEKNKINTFGVKGGNGFSTYIYVSTDVENQGEKETSNICKFKVPIDSQDAKLKQLSRDYLVGAIKIINSIIDSDINYGDIDDVIDSNDMISKYIPNEIHKNVVFDISNNIEISLINNEYTYNQKVNII
jgi:hypothetical protein